MRYALGGFWIPALLCAVLIPSFGKAAPPSAVQLVAGIDAVLVPQSEKRDGVLTVSDNTVYVQCVNTHFLPAWRCEAAGLKGQSWLEHLLTAERQKQLIALGFTPDPQFGNFVATLPRTMAPDSLAKLLFQVLGLYEVKPDDVTIHSDWLKTARCHRRIKANHDRGGSIFTPKWGFRQDVEKRCGTAFGAEPLNDDDPTAIMPVTSGIDLDARYLAAMTSELMRIEDLAKAYAIFEAGPAYVQCMPDIEDKSMYCEAVSEDAVGKPIERILTPERKAKLLAAGFEPPGKVMNYRRLYPLAQYDMHALAKALLDILRDVYGYQGEPPMKVIIENGSKRQLAP